jgi:DNA-binding transcriptional LysR family regulator
MVTDAQVRLAKQKLIDNKTQVAAAARPALPDEPAGPLPAGPPWPAGEEPSIQRTLEGSSLETIRHMVASGMGITLLPCTAAAVGRYTSKLLAIRRFPGEQPARRIALAWRASFPRPKAIEALRRAVLDCPLECVRRLPRAATGGGG